MREDNEVAGDLIRAGISDACSMLTLILIFTDGALICVKLLLNSDGEYSRSYHPVDEIGKVKFDALLLGVASEVCLFSGIPNAARTES